MYASTSHPQSSVHSTLSELPILVTTVLCTRTGFEWHTLWCYLIASRLARAVGCVKVCIRLVD